MGMSKHQKLRGRGEKWGGGTVGTRNPQWKAEVDIWSTAEPRAQEPGVEPHILLLLMVSVFCVSDSNPRPLPVHGKASTVPRSHPDSSLESPGLTPGNWLLC